MDPARHPLGPKVYSALADEHPRSTDPSKRFPAVDADLVIRRGLQVALDANKGAVMRKRQEVVGQVRQITKASLNDAEATAICQFFLKLNCSNDTMMLEGWQIMEWMDEVDLRQTYPAIHTIIHEQCQHFALQALFLFCCSLRLHL